MKAVEVISKQFGFKLSGILLWCISIIVDNIAKKLPTKDIKIPDIILSVSGQF